MTRQAEKERKSLLYPVKNSCRRNVRQIVVMLLVSLGLIHLGFFRDDAKTPKDLFLVPLTKADPARLSHFDCLPTDSETIAEKKKIFFLIEQVKGSPYRFVRNGTVYSGPEAAAHLRMKYSHAYNQIHTARGFVIYVASHSLMTGQPYLVITADGHRYPVQELFFNELERLEQTSAA